MKDIGIRDLKKNASHLVRHVAESREPYTITRRGEAVAVLSPFQAGRPASPSGEDAWERFESLAVRLEKARGPIRSAIDELHKMRR